MRAKPRESVTPIVRFCPNVTVSRFTLKVPAFTHSRLATRIEENASMRNITRTAFALALGWVAVGAADASAAWDNVFQATCDGSSSRSYYFAPAPSACCPSVSYVQRSYYQPVTTYKQESYYEPITTYRTSYYWAPVTSYRYTSYYDPCTGCTQQVATPHTSYYLRSQCNSVQSYVQRCRMVPVTEMRTSYYLEPVVTYYDPCGRPVAAAPSAGVAGPPPGTIPPARIGESGGPAAGINESSEPPKIKSPGIQESAPRRVMPAAPASPVRADHVASRSSTGGRLQGQVVRDDRITPKANATLRFVNENDEEVVAKADRAGRFAVNLPAGEWTLYTPGKDGDSVFHSTVYVKQADDRRVTVVSR
jgi:hypothetical protein